MEGVAPKPEDSGEDNLAELKQNTKRKKAFSEKRYRKFNSVTADTVFDKN